MTVLRTALLTLALGLAAAPAALAQPANGPESFSELAKRLSPAVVNISTRQTVTYEGGLPEFPPGSPLERFNDFFGGPGGDRVANSLGSGFVIDPDGVVVTNNHVVEDADEVAINFADGTSLPAEVIGLDPATDLAVLRVESDEPLPFVQFGDSDAAEVGDWVVAIGNPFGLGGTLTQGIISARNRNIESGPYDDFIQTDAAINRGNSGGPLFDMDGRVIGVNTAILSPTGANVGISFSVPSNIAAPVVNQLVEYGVARRGYLGVRVRVVGPDDVEERGLDSAAGAIITEITEDGPADEAGLELNDLILSFNGQEIEDDQDLVRIVAQTEIGATVEVEYLRDERRRTAEVEIGEMESDVQAPTRTVGIDDGPDSLDMLGMTLAPLTGADRRRLGIAPDVQGVLVTEVDEASDAAGKIRPDDVVEEIAWEPISSLEEAQDRLDAIDDSAGQVQIVVNRRGSLLIRSLAR